MSDNKPQRPETILDDPALALKANKQGDMEKEPTLRPGYYENNPRLIVHTRVPNDRNNGKIEAAFSNQAFYAFLRAIEAVANHNGPTAVTMDNKGHRFIEKKRDPNPSIMSSIQVKKLENGVVTICISAGKNRPLIEFPFIDTTYHQFRGADGNPLDMTTASKLYALGWVDMVRQYLPAIIRENYAKPAWMTRNQQGGGQQNGGGNWNNGGGGNQWNNNNRNNGGGSSNGGSNYGGSSNGGNNYGGGSSNPVSGGSNFDFSDDVPL